MKAEWQLCRFAAPKITPLESTKVGNVIRFQLYSPVFSPTTGFQGVFYVTDKAIQPGDASRIPYLEKGVCFQAFKLILTTCTCIPNVSIFTLH